MKKIINLLEAHAVTVYRVDFNYYVHEGEKEICINFWDWSEALDFLGYDSGENERNLHA